MSSACWDLIFVTSVQRTLGRFTEAESMYRQALDGRLQKFGAQSPVTASTAKHLASLLLTANGYLRDPTRALELALEANAATGHANPDYLDVLATAYFQTGDVEMALEIEAKAIESLPNDSPKRAEYEQRHKEFQAILDARQDDR